MTAGVTILGGELKRRHLGSVPKGLYLRPILARIKKSLFDILKQRVSGSAFLDLFAGSGSVGLEALSRGAREVVFVDTGRESQKWIEDSLRKISGQGGLLGLGEARFYRTDAAAGLKWLGRGFDLIFAGPPYKDRAGKPVFYVEKLLEVVCRDRALNAGGWLVIQHSKGEKFAASREWLFFRQEHYGDSALSFFRHAEPD